MSRDYDMRGSAWCRSMEAASDRFDKASGIAAFADVYFSSARARRALREAEAGVGIIRRALERKERP